MCDGLVPVPGHHDALAGGQPVVLDHVRRAEPVQGGRQLGGGAAYPGAGGGHAGRGHHLLGVGLRALQPRSRSSRAEAGDAGGPDRVRGAGDEWHLGTDDDQVGAQVGSQRRDRRGVPDGERPLLGDHRGAGVARCADQRGHRWIGGERQAERVLAGTAAHHQDPHAPTTSSTGGAAIGVRVAKLRRRPRNRARLPFALRSSPVPVVFGPSPWDWPVRARYTVLTSLRCRGGPSVRFPASERTAPSPARGARGDLGGRPGRGAGRLLTLRHSTSAEFTSWRSSSRSGYVLEGTSWVKKCAVIRSTGSTQNAVLASPPHEYSPTLDSTSRRTGSTTTAKPSPKPTPW